MCVQLALASGVDYTRLWKHTSRGKVARSRYETYVYKTDALYRPNPPVEGHRPALRISADR